MIRSFLVLFYLTATFSAISQIKGEITNVLGSDFKRNAAVYSINNSNKDSACVFVHAGDNVQGFLINEKTNVASKFSFKTPSKKALSLGAYFNKEKISFLFAKDIDADIFYVYNYWVRENKTDSFSLKADFQKLVPLTLVNTGKNIFILCVDKKTPVLSLYEINQSGLLLAGSYNLELLSERPYKKSELYDKLSTNTIIKNVNAVYVNQCQQKQPAILQNHNKIYYRNDSLIITLDRFKKTDVIYIDISTGKTGYRAIEQSSEFCYNNNPVFVKYNSFLFGNDLYFATACLDGLQVNINNIYDGKMISKLLSAGNDSLVFDNTPVVKTTGSMGTSLISKNVYAVRTTKSFLRQISGNNLLISCEYDSTKNIVMRIGTYNTADAPSSAIIPGAMFGLSGVLLSYALFPNGWEKAIYFKSHLNKATFEHIPGEVAEMTEEKIDYQITDRRTQSASESVFTINGVNYFAYYDGLKDSIVFVQL